MRSFLENVGARGGSALLQALLMILLARLTTLAEFGSYGVSLSIGAVALGFLALGLPTRALRSHVGDGVALAAVRITALSAILAGLIATGGAIIAIPSIIAPAIAGGTAMYNEAQGNIYQSIAFAHRRFRRVSALMISRRLFPLAGVAFGTLFPDANDRSTLIFAGLIVGNFAAVIAGRMLVQPMLNRPSVSYRTLVSESRPYWLANIWAMLQQLDVVIVASVLGSAASAAFSAAFRVASPIHIVTGIITSRLIPEVTAHLDDLSAKNPASRYMRIGFAYATLVVIASPVLAWVGILALGKDFEPFWSVFVVLIVNSGASVVNQVVAAWIVARNELQTRIAPATAVSSIIGLLLVGIACLTGNLLLAAFGTLSIQLILSAIYFLLIAHARRSQ